MKFLFLALFASAVITAIIVAMLSSVLMSELRIFMDKRRRVCRLPVDLS